MPARKWPDPGPYEQLYEACLLAELRLEIHYVGPEDQQIPILMVRSGTIKESYSRRVEPGESFDQAASIILDALQRGKVL